MIGSTRTSPKYIRKHLPSFDVLTGLEGFMLFVSATCPLILRNVIFTRATAAPHRHSCPLRLRSTRSLGL
ncbi:hypothetical protein A0H81_08972 [Grifola frondosa]|uniref:Uncharacterized protein n=1 Tax=Grifola frondosa TaxID=5627 RepID=A0A1C7M501_GRIFR|nr:hypothetical protein A0H81_08972 [Grifola frondosa]